MDTIIAAIREEAAEACFEFVMQNMKPEAFVKKAFQHSEIHHFHKKTPSKLILNQTVVLLQILQGVEKLTGISEEIRKQIVSEHIENLQKILDE